MEAKNEKRRQRNLLFLALFGIAIVISLIYGCLTYYGEIGEALAYIKAMNWPCLLLLIPVIILMYYAAGRIWYPYLKETGLSAGQLGSIQYELNFVNTVVPYVKLLPGLFYAQGRLEKHGVSKTEAAMLYAFRYYVSIATKWIEIVIAMIILMVIGKAGEMPVLARWIVCLLSVGILGGMAIVLWLCLKKKVRMSQRLLNNRLLGGLARKADVKLDGLFQIFSHTFGQKGALTEAFIWGMVYSLLEVLPFWIVALATGHPELLLQIIAASGVAITLGVVTPTPMGIGGFDGAMILFLGSMGPNVALVSTIVITARVLTLVGTSVTGIPFWLNGMRQINQK